MSGILYLLPNALGPAPLEAVLPAAALHVAAQLDYFIVENAKSARAFLKRVEALVALAQPLQAVTMAELNVATGAAELPRLIEPLVAGRAAALISEAGCPAVADPGANLIALAHERGVTVRPLVGPSSILLALMASGLNGQSFAFCGYLPRDAAARTARIRALEERSRRDGQTQIFIETPYRNGVLFQALLATLDGTTRLCVALDLTSAEETVSTRPVRQWQGAAAPDLERRPAVFLLLAA